MNIEELKFVFTGNRHGQVLVFKNHDEAYEWLSSATRLSHEEKEREIRGCVSLGTPFWSTCPPQISETGEYV